MHKKIYGFALGALMTAMFVSCNEGINNPDNGDKIITFQLAKNPEIVAWSGSYALTSYSTTRADEDGSGYYDDKFPDDLNNIDFNIPAGAIPYTQPSDYKNDGDIYYIPAGDYPNGISFPDNKHATLYIEKGAKIKNLGGNGLNMDIYICEGAEVTFDWSPSSGSWNFYNNGSLNFPGGITNNIKNLYNIGSSAKLKLGSENQYGMTINDGTNICNKGGYIEITVKDDQYSQVQVNTPIISDNVIKVNGNIKFQKSGDICDLQVTGTVEINEFNLIFGIIECKKLIFDGKTFKLHNNGYIHASEEIVVNSSGSRIETLGDKALVETNKLTINLTNSSWSSTFGEGVYLNVPEENIFNTGQSYSDTRDDISYRLNKITANDVHPSCGSQDEPETKPDPDPDPEPEPPFIPHPVSEVEVNLAINDQHTAQGINDLVSKLSIHVRYPGDVQIFIPIEQKWYCSQDDLYILNNHQEGNFIHGGPETISYNVGGYNVTLTFKYNDNGIYVTTGGINSQVFDHCVRNFGDGINFEVYMYMNDQANLTMDWFKRVLNGSTIKFIDKDEYNVGYPNYYINAFTDHGQGHGWDQDCAVNIIVEQENGFDRGVSGVHLNDSPYNWIYTSQSFLSSFPEDKDWDERVGSHGYHKHTFLWGEDED